MSGPSEQAPSAAEVLKAAKVKLGTVVQEAVRTFQKDTGIAVGAIHVSNHYSYGELDADLAVVTTKYLT